MKKHNRSRRKEDKYKDDDKIIFEQENKTIIYINNI